MYKLTCEIIIHNVSSPGTWLPNRDDIYLTIDTFNHVKRTNLSTAAFPLQFQKKFTFEKVFWSCSSAKDVVNAMEDLPVTVELRQVADIYLGGTLLAYFDTNARDFFYPCSNFCPRSVYNREMLMIRTVDFPGVSPKVQFSSYAIIQELPRSLARKGDSKRSKSCRDNRPARPVYPMAAEPGYGLHTVNSALRSRSPSPHERARAKGHVISDIVNHKVKYNDMRKSTNSLADDRQPFVVRHVNEQALSRKPKFHKACQFAGDNCSMSKHQRRCHARCHSPTRMLTASVGEKLDSTKSRRNIEHTVRSLSRPSSPRHYHHHNHSYLGSMEQENSYNLDSYHGRR